MEVKLQKGGLKHTHNTPTQHTSTYTNTFSYRVQLKITARNTVLLQLWTEGQRKIFPALGKIKSANTTLKVKGKDRDSTLPTSGI